MLPYREFDSSPLARFVRFVSRSFRIRYAFGVEVRMYWAAAILMPLIFLRWIVPSSGGTLEAAVLTTVCVVGLFAVIWTHEMGHIAMGRRYGVHSNLITLSPMGGVAHMSAPATGPRVEFLVAAAGPAVHLAWLAVCWPLWKLLPARLAAIDGWTFAPIEFTLWFLVTTNASLLLFNLLPVFALDGGRMLRAFFATRTHPNRATLWATTVGFVGGGLMIVYGFTQGPVASLILIVIGLSCVQACLNERRIARWTHVYNQTSRAPWESDPDAWRQGAADTDPSEARPGVLARWREQRAADKQQRAEAEQRALDAQVDAILDRVHKVGMGGLSDREKATLKRASQKRRGAG